MFLLVSYMIPWASEGYHIPILFISQFGDYIVEKFETRLHQ